MSFHVQCLFMFNVKVSTTRYPLPPYESSGFQFMFHYSGPFFRRGQGAF